MRITLDARQISGSATRAVQEAIDLAARDGGRVALGAGDYACGALELKTGVTLELEAGARIVASTDLTDYPPIGYHHSELGDVQSLIYAKNARDIAIVGDGEIDLRGDAFFDFSRPLIPEEMRGRISEAQVRECTVFHEQRVNQPLFFLGCERVKLRDVTVRNSPCWTITFAQCKNVRVDDLTIENSLNIPNDDGIHLCGCDGVVIRGCHIVCGDDCIALTGITDWSVPCQNVVISDCILESCSKALDIGYIHSIVRNVAVSNVVIRASNRGLTIMSNPRTGLVENVVFANCTIDTRVRAGNWWGNGEPICVMATEHSGRIAFDGERDFPASVRNIVFTGITCTAENVLAIVGQNGNIRDIDIDHVSVRLKPSANRALKGDVVDISPSRPLAAIPKDGRTYGALIQGARDVRLRDVRLYGEDGEAAQVALVDADVRGVYEAT